MSEPVSAKQVPEESVATSAEAEHVEIHPWGPGDTPPTPVPDPDRHLVSSTEL